MMINILYVNVYWHFMATMLLLIEKNEIQKHPSCNKVVAKKRYEIKGGGQGVCRNAVDHIKIFDTDGHQYKIPKIKQGKLSAMIRPLYLKLKTCLISSANPMLLLLTMAELYLSEFFKLIFLKTIKVSNGWLFQIQSHFNVIKSIYAQTLATSLHTLFTITVSSLGCNFIEARVVLVGYLLGRQYSH